jgi:PAS domain S-box-containing protein
MRRAEVVPIRHAFHDNGEWDRDLLEHSQDLLCIHDLSGRLLSLNPTPARLLGYSVEEILQIPMRELVAAEFRPQFDAYLKQIARTGKAEGFLALRTRTGERRIWRYQNTLQTTGVASAFVRGIAHDVTESKRTQERLKEYERVVEGLEEMIVVLDRDYRYVIANRAFLAYRGLPKDQVIGHTIAEVLDPEIFETIIQPKMDACFAGKIVQYELTYKYQYSTPRTMWASYFPIEGTGGIDRIACILQDITERKCEQQRLKEYERAVEGLQEMIVVLDHNYRYVIANQSFLQYRGMAREDLLGRGVLEQLKSEGTSEAALTVMKQRLDECLAGKVVKYEKKQFYAQGGERDLLVSYFPVEDTDGLNRVAVVMQDVTERNKAQQGLQKSEEKFSKLFRQSPMSISLTTLKDHRYVDVNESFERLTGWSRDEALGRTAFDLGIWTELEQRAELEERLHAEGTVRDVEVEIHRKDGSPGVFWGTTELIDIDGEKCVIGAFTDITDRKQAEEQMRQQAALLGLAHDAIMVRGMERSEIQFWNRGAADTYGWSAAEALGKISHSLLQTKFPVPLPTIEKCVTEQGEWQGELKHTARDGKEIIVTTRWSILRNNNGEAQAILEIDRDITEHKKAEEALAEAKEFSENLIHTANVMILSLDANGNIILLNEAAEKITGYSFAELKGKNWSRLVPRERFPHVWKVFDELMDGTACQTFENPIITKNGEERYIAWRNNPLKVNGKIVATIAFGNDITERRQAEEKLKLQTARLKILAEASRAFAEVGQDYQSVLNEVARQLAAALGDICLLRLASADSTTLELAAVHGMPSDQSDALLVQLYRASGEPGTPGTSAEVFRTGKAAFVPQIAAADELQARTKPDSSEIPENFVPHSYIMVPLRSQGKPTGVLTLIRHRAERPGFSEEDLTLAQDLADSAALAISNARLLAQVQDELSERRRAEKALRRSEEKYRMFVSQSSEGIFREEFASPVSIDLPEDELVHRILHDGDIAESNGALAAMYGLTSGEYLLGKCWAQLFPPDDPQNVELTRGYIRSGFRVLGVESHEVDVQGNSKVFLNSMIGIVENRTLVRTWGIQRDVTETVMREDARRRAEEELRTTVRQLCETTAELGLAKEKLSEEKLYLEQAIDTELGFGEIIGRSSALKGVMEKVAKVAPSDATVLLLGETGTGKELVARALHRQSKRQGNSFIKMNCAAIPSGLLESELFGHERGAFTGAVARKLGRLELADRGTLFLDEIGEIPLSVQPKLLRVLQDMEFERLGGTQTLKVNFRLLAATNRDLLQAVKNREFRSDLYYRLKVFPILIPPLRERREDVRPLIEHFVRKFSLQMKKSITSIPTKTMELLVRWDWPGNIRELENFVERSVILTPGSVLQSPLSELQSAIEEPGNNGTLRDKERESIMRVLRDCHGRLGGADGAAARLGLKRTTLQSKLDHLGIKPAVYRLVSH